MAGTALMALYLPDNGWNAAIMAKLRKFAGDAVI
jgi:hypothetical protein